MRLMIDARTLGSRPSGIGIYTHSYIQELRKNPQIELALLSDVCESDELTALRQQGVQVVLYGRSVMKKRCGLWIFSLCTERTSGLEAGYFLGTQ